MAPSIRSGRSASESSGLCVGRSCVGPQGGCARIRAGARAPPAVAGRGLHEGRGPLPVAEAGLDAVRCDAVVELSEQYARSFHVAGLATREHGVAQHVPEGRCHRRARATRCSAVEDPREAPVGELRPAPCWSARHLAGATSPPRPPARAHRSTPQPSAESRAWPPCRTRGRDGRAHRASRPRRVRRPPGRAQAWRRRAPARSSATAGRRGWRAVRRGKAPRRRPRRGRLPPSPRPGAPGRRRGRHRPRRRGGDRRGSGRAPRRKLRAVRRRVPRSTPRAIRSVVEPTRAAAAWARRHKRSSTSRSTFSAASIASMRFHQSRRSSLRSRHCSTWRSPSRAEASMPETSGEALQRSSQAITMNGT